MGFFNFLAAGGGLLLIGGFEALTSSNPKLKSPNKPSSSSFVYFSFSVLSFFFVLNSLISFFDALNSHDRVGSALQLQVMAIASLFLLYSVIGILVSLKDSLALPSSILELIALFAFVEEFLLFYLQRKDTSGIENRYFDLLLVPITICVFSTIIELKKSSSSESNCYPKLARGVVTLQGMWFLQMGVSFYTKLMADGCSLHEKSRGNYTVKCKGHPEYHRARAIATLLFNCHLAFLVVLVVGVYSIKAMRNGGSDEFTEYRLIGAEMQKLENQGQFSLDGDGEEEDDNGNLVDQKLPAVEVGMNGHASSDQ